MQTLQRSRLSWTKRVVVAIAAIASMFSVSAVTSQAHATVYSSCTMSQCADAVSANSIWSSMGYPTNRGWHAWPDGQYNYSGGQYYNYDGQLPSGAGYLEYDVYSRPYGAHRDAYRIVVSVTSGTVWFSPNHYTDFYQL